jgi:hypothetical protein
MCQSAKSSNDSSCLEGLPTNSTDCFDCTTCFVYYLLAATQDVEDSEMEEDEDSQADGFVVDDGYLSAGEGGPIDNDDFGAEVEGRQPHSRFQLHLTDLLDAQLP